MEWHRKVSKSNGINSSFSISSKLKKERKSSDEFEFMLNKLSLEEIIALKLEISSRLLGGKIYGFQLWSAMPKIVKEALMLYAISASNTDSDAAELLNMPNTRFMMLKKAFKTSKYFETSLEEFKK
jgi:hypothetical protein